MTRQISSGKLIYRFCAFYRKHERLFILDMSVAFGVSVISVLMPYIVRNLLKTYLPEKNSTLITQSFIILTMIVLAKAYFTFIRIKWGHILGVRMEADMRSTMFNHLQKLSFSYFDNVKTGHIMSRISGDLETIAEIAHHAPEDLIISICVLTGAFSFMIFLDPVLTAVAAIPVISLICWGIFYGKHMKTGFKKVRERIADINSSVENSVSGIREVKSYANENLEIDKFSTANTSYRNAKEKVYHIMANFYTGMGFWMDFHYLCIISAGSLLILKGRIDLADLIAFTIYIDVISKPVDRLVNFVEQLQQGAASFERFVEIMDIEPDISDRSDAHDLINVKGAVEFQGVSFKYNTSPSVILNDVSLSIQAGETVALVGESGAGKSTLVSLIPRFYEPQQGKILIDGNNVSLISQKSLRENIGIVQQNVFLFDGTIRENIMYGDIEASDEKLIQSAADANILDFIKSLPEGFETQVGERGIKLSGGQKQRIAIARVFLKNPAVLILDEATSSLDSESESLIQEALLKLSQNRTTIVIAHRLSTVRNAKRIFVLRQGKLAESGTHDQLISDEGYYYSLYTRHLF